MPNSHYTAIQLYFFRKYLLKVYCNTRHHTKPWGKNLRIPAFQELSVQWGWQLCKSVIAIKHVKSIFGIFLSCFTLTNILTSVLSSLLSSQAFQNPFAYFLRVGLLQIKGPLALVPTLSASVAVTEETSVITRAGTAVRLPAFNTSLATS